MVLSDSENNLEPIARARSASDAAEEGISMSVPVPSCALSPYMLTSPNLPSTSTSSHTSSTASHTSTSTYNTPIAIPTDIKTRTNPQLSASQYNFVIPSPPLQSSLYPETIVIPGPNIISQPSPPGNNTIVSPSPNLLYPSTITLATIIPTLQSTNTSTTTTYTTATTTPLTSPIASTSSRIITSPKLAPLFPEHLFQKPTTPKKTTTRHRLTTTETETDDDDMDFESAYILVKNKRARSPTSPLTNINPPKRSQKNKTKNPTKKWTSTL